MAAKKKTTTASGPDGHHYLREKLAQAIEIVMFTGDRDAIAEAWRSIEGAASFGPVTFEDANALRWWATIASWLERGANAPLPTDTMLELRSAMRELEAFLSAERT